MNAPTRLIIAALLLFGPPQASAIDTARSDVGEFIDAMVAAHDYERETLVAALEAAEVQPDVLEAISDPAERTLSWAEYRDIFLTDKRVQAGAEFWREHRATLERISVETGVSSEVLVGILGVETYFGRITGDYRVLEALVTLAFEYPPRASFFRRELEEFLLLVREERMDPGAATGSYAGAMGAPQFMPSSYRAYAVDSSDDGKRDIWSDWQDVIGSIANYLSAHGWQPGAEVVARALLGDRWQGEPPVNSLQARETVASLSRRGVLFATALDAGASGQLLTFDGADGDEHWVGFHNFFVLTRYNRSVMYALAVYQLGQEIAHAVRRGDA